MLRQLIAVMLLCGTTAAGLAAPLPGFQQGGPFGEQTKWDRLPSGVRMFVDAPADLRAKERLLIVYATPNGNTLEQTLGAAASKGLDFRFDIQHVAAQTRRFRELDPSRDVVLAVVQSPVLSWPAFRQNNAKAGEIIRELVGSLAEGCGAKRIVLACHSGGGSFVLGYISAVDAIPSSVERIILLDANYSYSDEARHGDKLLAWLEGDAQRRLVVVAYDDREVTYNGKKVVGPEGGTFRASQRMIARFHRDGELAEQNRGPLRRVTGRNGQIDMLLHMNPDNKILHTALVGEMNGLLYGLALGTAREAHCGFGEPRAYTKWIQPEPFVEPPAAAAGDSQGQTDVRLTLPDRPADAPSGSAFRDRIAAMPLAEREAAIVAEIARGNVPGFLRRMKPIPLAARDAAGTPHVGTCFVTPDYLAVGADEDFFRVPMTPRTAWKIADALGCSLLTTKLSDDVHAAAEIKLEPRPLTVDREAVATFFEHHAIIEKQLAGKPRGSLVAGIKKDVVLTNRLTEKPHKVAIHGWHYPDGRPIQPLYVGHRDTYVDYSHGVRLLAGDMLADGRRRKTLDVLEDKDLCGLVSDEGPIDASALRFGGTL
ncbi:MAG: hypothetical protein JW809_04205 [Pirellulales bacterium]|nr:hypothetical protein [Pirellulales bacterium]